MRFGTEIFSVVAVGLLLSLLCSLICGLCDPLRTVGTYYMSERNAKSHYKLEKSRLLFFPIFITNKKMKDGYISRRSFWETISFYFYYLVLIITEVALYFTTNQGIFPFNTQLFLALLLIPAFLTVIYCLIALIKKERTDYLDLYDLEEAEFKGSKKSNKDGIETDEEIKARVQKELNAKVKRLGKK